MSDQNTNATDQGTAQATEASPAKLYPTRAEAEANKPADATKNHRIYEVRKAGAVVGYLWARGSDNALALTARSEGYTASIGNSASVTKEALAAKLSEFSDDELLTLGLSRKKGKK